MTDRALQNAQARRAALVAEAERVETELAVLRQNIEAVDTFIRSWYSFAEGVEQPVVLGDRVEAAILRAHERREAVRAAVRNRSEAATLNPKRDDVVRVVRELIGAAGKPLTHDILMEELERRGMQIHGTDPRGVFNTMMWRSAGIVRLDKLGFWLPERPWPEAGYDPTAAAATNDTPSLEDMLR